MAEGGEGIPVYQGQEIKPGDSFILPKGTEYKPQIDKTHDDVVVQDKVPTREQPTLSREAQITAEQVEAARTLLRDLPPNTSLEDRRAAQQLIEEAIKNNTSIKEADPLHPTRLDRQAERPIQQLAQSARGSLKDRFFEWIGIKNKEQKAA